MPTFNRGYLLISIIAALVIPSLTFTYNVDIMVNQPIETEIYTDLQKLPLSTPEVTEDKSILPITLLIFIYAFGVLIFAGRFIFNLLKIIGKIRANQKQGCSGFVRVLVKHNIVPHTFMKYIFLSKTDFEAKQIPREVLLHEETHAREKHSLDIIFIELLLVVFWFNPVLWLYKKSIKINHEFLADRSVVNNQTSIQAYFNILVSYPSSPNQAELASSFNYSLTKKRLEMMTKQFSKKRMTYKLLGLIPLVALCIFLFNNEIVANEHIVYTTNDIINNLEDNKLDSPIPNKSSIPYDIVDEKIIDSIDKELKEIEKLQINYSEQDPASKKEIRAYSQWAKKINKAIENEDSIILKKSILDEMQGIYARMTQEQKDNAPSFPAVPEPPIAPVPPMPEIADVEPPSPPEINEEEIERMEKEIEEQIEDIEEQIEIAVEQGNSRIDEEMIRAETARVIAEQGRQIAEQQRAIARESAMIARQQAQEAAQMARLSAKQRKEVAEQAREAAQEARKIAIEEARISRQEVQEIAKQARKEAIKARKEAIKARKETLKIHQKANGYNTSLPPSPPKPTSPIEFISERNPDKTDFYYRGEKISKEKALEIVENSKNNLSIDAKSKNDKMTITIKN